MISLRNVFLLVSVCSFGNLYCSDKPVDEHKMVISSTDSHNNAATASEKQSDDIPQLIPKPQPSNFLTRTWYGITKHVAGMSAYSIIMELHNNGKLKADFENNPDEAMNRFNETASERFTKKDLLAADKQAKISHLIEIVTDISNEFELAKTLAARYIELQRTATTSILTKHALEEEPALRNKRRQKIKEAHREYNEELKKLYIHAKNAAYNCRYLDTR